MGKNSAERRRKAEERRRERERAERRSRILRVTAFTGAGVLFAGLVGFGVWVAYDRGAGGGGVQASDIENLKTYDSLTNTHVSEPVDYKMSPPAGGNHHAVWQNCGVYDAPLSSMNAVHSLEHGAVWVTYQPDLPQEQVDKLNDLYTQGSYILVSPFDGQEMPAPIVASAWGNQIELQSPDDERLSQFLRAFERSPNVPEPGAACTGGLNLNAAELEEAGGIGALGGGMQR
ncbi:DUF3105 domain-containing protein [Streptomonospora litoralis]|uniref:DUF3105 domain-containing protein n=1 Tax=Streptomonospora litoralis TaxID=2498135 RepID=A0A4P6Q5X8_9ACTN|nr:DUF3105 domain-containing protein [Streptomonospora litoralis]QBI55700.1 hypothetical protein EKD16_19685 [Streptomonospora litoralis]